MTETLMTTNWHCDCGEVLDSDKARTHKCRRGIEMDYPSIPPKKPHVGPFIWPTDDEDAKLPDNGKPIRF